MGDILVVNAGSTSLKLSLVDEGGGSATLDSLDDAASARPEAVAHRVVHGGARFEGPALIDAGVRRRIVAETRAAPLHNVPALAAIDAARRVLPHVPHVAVFDTSFHRTMPAEAATYAIPRRWRDWGIRRFGFHGLSVEWCARRAPELLGRPAAGLRLVVCHLGGGCSVTAVRGGRSVDTTMGFTPLEGVPMATRAGSVDPGALLHLLQERGLTAEELARALNEESGLLGLSESSSSAGELEARLDVDERARLALDVYAHRVAGAAAAMAAGAGGIDALVFTAGVGEHSPYVRRQVCSRLAFLGIELDEHANEAAAPDADVAAAGSPVRVPVLRAREELVAAAAARDVLRERFK